MTHTLHKHAAQPGGQRDAASCLQLPSTRACTAGSLHTRTVRHTCKEHEKNNVRAAAPAP